MEVIVIIQRWKKLINFARKDQRIKYRRLKKNLGISANTNACIAISSGQYLGLLDHDDILHPSALYEVMKAICEEKADFIYTDEAKFTSKVQECFSPNYKPDYAKDDLRAHNYICHFTVYSRELLNKVGLYQSEYDGSQDHDIVLRMTEHAKHIVHIPKILYFWRVHKNSVSAGIEAKSYAIEAAQRAVKMQLNRNDELGKVSSIPPYQTLYKIDYPLKSADLITVIIYGISTLGDLMRCIKSMEDQTAYYPMEVCLVEGMMDPKLFYTALKRIPTVKPIVAITKEEQEKVGGSLRAAIQKTHGEYLAFLHASTAILSRDWVKEMLMFAQRNDVGAVGAKICTGRETIYSAGITLDSAEPSLLHHMYRGENFDSPGYEAGLKHARNITAIDGQCMMISREKLIAAGGLEEGLAGYLFIDLCLRLRQAGYLNVWTPFTAATFWGSVSYTESSKKLFFERWRDLFFTRDPYYNPNIKKYMIF